MRRAEHTLGPEPASVAGARRFARTCLEDWGIDHEVIEDAVLIVSEAVTNAFLHARTAVSLRLSASERTLRIEVHDGSSLFPVRKRYAQDAGTGRGMLLLEAVSSRWGAEHEGDGKVVWFERDLPAGLDQGADGGGRRSSGHAGAGPRRPPHRGGETSGRVLRRPPSTRYRDRPHGGSRRGERGPRPGAPSEPRRPRPRGRQLSESSRIAFTDSATR